MLQTAENEGPPIRVFRALLPSQRSDPMRIQVSESNKMSRFNAILALVFAFGLMTSVSMAKYHSRAKALLRVEAPMAVAPKPAATESPEASPPASTPTEDAKMPAPASASSLSHTAQTPASVPLAAGPATTSPPKSGATATAKVEKIMAILGAALIGGAIMLL